MKTIFNQAYNLYKKYQTSDPHRLCEYLGINLLYADLPESTDGIYYSVADKPIILINQNISPQKSRYVTAHELGHALFHHDRNYMFMAERTYMKTHRFETEADYFCASLLMCETLKNHSVNSLTVGQISNLSGLPEELVKLWIDNTEFDWLNVVRSE